MLITKGLSLFLGKAVFERTECMQIVSRTSVFCLGKGLEGTRGLCRTAVKYELDQRASLGVTPSLPFSGF